MKKVINLVIVSICMMLFSACSDKDNASPDSGMDLKDYAIVGKFVDVINTDGGLEKPYIMTFEANVVTMHSIYGQVPFNYSVQGDKIIFEDNGYFVLEGDHLTSQLLVGLNLASFKLLKIPETSAIAGKTFAGSYLKTDNSILHQNFFYTILPEALKADVGLTVGTALRTEDYTPIGNMAAYIENDQSYSEFLLYLDGKLEVNYMAPGELYHGSFEEQ